eukprot:PDM67340.1 viln-1 [Pristionchus pacificus]
MSAKNTSALPCEKRSREEAIVTVSLASRLSRLSTSAEKWKSRVEKERDLDKCRPANRSGTVNIHTPTIPHFIDQGIATFFTRNNTTCVDIPSELLNLDCIEETEKLNMIRKSRITRPKKIPMSENIGGKHAKRITDFNFVKPLLEGVEEEIVRFVTSHDPECVVKGLSSTEDYNATRDSLRSPSNNTSSYPKMLLIQVGGEEFIDVRAVVASKESIDISASYLLITPSSLIIHNGSESKVLERSKAMQVATSILHTKQLNCGASKVDRTCDAERVSKQFWESLEWNGKKGTVVTGVELIKKNRIFSVDEQLEIKMEISGDVPCYSLLQPRKCLILDFHSELWWWCGGECTRRQIQATEDYTNQMKSQLSYIIIEKITNGIPNVLFSSKIRNWPMTTPLLTSRPQIKTPILDDGSYKWKQCIQSDSSSIACHLMKSEEKGDDILVEDVALDGTNGNVITERKDLWILNGDGLLRIEEKEEDRLVAFKRDGCYVVRWQYRIATRVGRLVKGESEGQRETGRQRIAFFYWLGRKSGVKERGMCALRLSEMDKSKSPHIRMEEGNETGIFLSLFKGLFTVIESDINGDRLFLVLWKSHGRSSFSQIDVSSPLRSQGTYIRKKEGKCVVLAGIHSNINDVRAALDSWDGSSKEMEYMVEGDDTTIEWIDPHPHNDAIKFTMYRILATESDIVQPCRPGTTFPYSQCALDTCILLDYGNKGWLWSEIPLSDTALNVANIMKEKFKWTNVDLIEKGSEPKRFKALFPLWDDYVEGKEERFLKLEDVMRERMSLTPAEAIQRRKLRDEVVDIENLEKNLPEELFFNMYGMTKNSFANLAPWKRILVRKNKGFF